MPTQTLIQLIVALKKRCLAQEASIRDALALGVTEYSCLSALAPGEELSCSAVAKLLGLSASRATRLIDELIERNLLVREQGPDRRTLSIRLSAKGEVVHGQILEAFSQCERELQLRLTPEEYENAQGVMHRIISITEQPLKSGRNESLLGETAR